MQNNIPVPNFKIDPTTNEVRIPYDQFHTWMSEVVEKVNSIQAILELSEFDVQMKELKQRVDKAWGCKDVRPDQ